MAPVSTNPLLFIYHPTILNIVAITTHIIWGVTNMAAIPVPNADMVSVADEALMKK